MLDRGTGGGAGAGALLLALLLLAGGLPAAPADDYVVLLAKAVKDDGIDYGEVEMGRAALDLHVRSLGERDPGATDRDRMAFWINAHNALVLQQVLDTKCRSVKDVQGFFDGRTWRVAGRTVTIDGIAAILGEYRQPLVRFGLYRASRSSPPLSAAPYRGEGLEKALLQQARSYLGDASQNLFEYAQLRAELSMLFFWHLGEFEAGRPFQLTLADLLPEEERFEAIARSLRTTGWSISYRPWDWSLDEAEAPRPSVHPAWMVLYALAALSLLLLGLRAFRALR